MNTIQQIKEAVAERFNLEPVMLDSERRHRELSVPRQMAYLLARNRTKLSYPAIAANMGGRDHTTIIHGMRKASLLIATDPEFKSAFDDVCRKLDLIAGSGEEIDLTNLGYNMKVSELVDLARRLGWALKLERL